MDWEKIERIEVIDNNGRQLVRNNVTAVQFDLVGDGETLKMFIDYELEED
mgnify:FL=1